MTTIKKAPRWYYFTRGPRRTVIRATPAKVERWDRTTGRWVPGLYRPESVFQGGEFDSITPEEARRLTSAR